MEPKHPFFTLSSETMPNPNPNPNTSPNPKLNPNPKSKCKPNPSPIPNPNSNPNPVKLQHSKPLTYSIAGSPTQTLNITTRTLADAT